MPILAYFATVGSLLLGLLYVAEAQFGPPTSLNISSEFHGLPAPWKAQDSIKILAAREAPVPVMPEAEIVQSAVQPKLEPPKKTKQVNAHNKQVHAHKKKRVAKAVPPNGARNRFAHSAASHHNYGTVW